MPSATITFQDTPEGLRVSHSTPEALDATSPAHQALAYALAFVTEVAEQEPEPAPQPASPIILLDERPARIVRA